MNVRAVVRGCGRSSKEIEDGMHRDAPRLRMVRYLPYDIIGLRALRRCSGLANKRWTRVILSIIPYVVDIAELFPFRHQFQFKI